MHAETPNWADAPEGATHYAHDRLYPWLRDGEYPAFFQNYVGQWKQYDEQWRGKEHISRAVARPSSGDVLQFKDTHSDELLVRFNKNSGRVYLTVTKGYTKADASLTPQMIDQLVVGLLQAKMELSK